MSSNRPLDMVNLKYVEIKTIDFKSTSAHLADYDKITFFHVGELAGASQLRAKPPRNGRSFFQKRRFLQRNI